LFLHHKRGELVRAEAFFNRGLQFCLPNLNINIMSTTERESSSKHKSQSSKFKQREGFDAKNTSSPKSLNHSPFTPKSGHISHISPTAAAGVKKAPPPPVPTHAPKKSSGVKLKHIIRFILSFAHFLTKV
jgi:hypothetical protein